MPLLAAQSLGILQATQDIQATRYAAIASATILVYDHLVSFNREIDLVWKREWSIIKGVFILHRYFGLVIVCVELAGHFWFRWETWGYGITVLTSEAVLLLWIFVLYDKRSRMLAILGSLFVAESIAVFIILGTSFRQFEVAVLPLPWFWTPILAYNGVILGLFLVKGFQTYNAIKQGKNVSLLQEIYRKSFVNFGAIFVAYFLCCVFWLAADFGLAQIPVGFAISFSITNATRLLLNIRHAYYMQMEVRIFGRGATQVRSTTPIYAQQVPPEQWLYELREMKWSGKA